MGAKCVPHLPIRRIIPESMKPCFYQVRYDSNFVLFLSFKSPGIEISSSMVLIREKASPVGLPDPG